MQIDIGLTQSQREEIAQHLSRLLADSYTLYLKTHNFHWNVTGPAGRNPAKRPSRDRVGLRLADSAQRTSGRLPSS